MPAIDFDALERDFTARLRAAEFTPTTRADLVYRLEAEDGTPAPDFRNPMLPCVRVRNVGPYATRLAAGLARGATVENVAGALRQLKTWDPGRLLLLGEVGYVRAHRAWLEAHGAYDCQGEGFRAFARLRVVGIDLEIIEERP